MPRIIRARKWIALAVAFAVALCLLALLPAGHGKASGSAGFAAPDAAALRMEGDAGSHDILTRADNSSLFDAARFQPFAAGPAAAAAALVLLPASALCARRSSGSLLKKRLTPVCLRVRMDE